MSEILYSTEALEEGIKKCQDNIKIFEEAIQKERNTMNDYQGMINVLHSKKRLAESGGVVKIEAEHGDND